MIDYDLKDWLQVVGLVVTIGTAFYVWLNAGGKRAETALDLFKADATKKLTQEALDIAGLERRMQKIEDMLPHLPDRDDFHQLQLSMTRMEGRMEALTDNFSANSKVVTKIDEYLRSQGK